MRRLLIVAAIFLIALVPGAGGTPAVAKLLLGNSGDLPRFYGQTGQRSTIHSLFLGWGQGSLFGTPLPQLLQRSGPIPMIHIGTKGRGGKPVITPRRIANGQGDAYLIALNQGISAYGGLVFARLMAEMNHYDNAYAAFRRNGTSRGPEYSPDAHAKAFRRFHIILHGGSKAAVNAKLQAAGLPGYNGPDLAVNPPNKLQTIWNPLGGGLPGIAENAPERFYPGDGYNDIVGNDIYGTAAGWSAAANEALYAFARAHGKPYSFPEWGLQGVDEPKFVDYICTFIKTRAAILLAAYFEAVPASAYDLTPKPKSKKRYRACMTPLGAPAPPGAGGQTPAPPGPNQMRIVPNPAAGPTPLDVTFDLFVKLPQPVVQWQVAFGDGQGAQGQGAPPDTVDHTYEDDGVYEAVLVVYLAPPFTGTAIRLITKTAVKVGDNAGVLMSLVAKPKSGKAPLKVVFTTTVNFDRTPVSWQLLYGDGLMIDGKGKPPGFLGHTYQRKGVYRAVLIVYLPPPFTGTAIRFLTYADVRAT